jgi:hypothetical protein
MRPLLVLLAVVLCWPASADAAAKRKPCPRDAELESRAATLAVRSDGDGYHRLVGCLRATRQRTQLAGWFAEGSVADAPSPQYWLTGRFAAINQPHCTADPFDSVPCTATLRVVDLRTRERKTTVELSDPVFELFLTTRGALGLIHKTDVITADGADVQVRDKAAEPGSLAFAERAGLLYWASAGLPRSAPLR